MINEKCQIKENINNGGQCVPKNWSSVAHEESWNTVPSLFTALHLPQYFIILWYLSGSKANPVTPPGRRSNHVVLYRCGFRPLPQPHNTAARQTPQLGVQERTYAKYVLNNKHGLNNYSYCFLGNHPVWWTSWNTVRLFISKRQGESTVRLIP